MMCVRCDRLIRLGVYVEVGCPDRLMICWPCHLELEGEIVPIPPMNEVLARLGEAE